MKTVQYALCTAAVAAAVAVSHAFGIVLCPLKRFAGVPCPSCGTTRAAVLLLRGDPSGAFAVQPLASALVCVGVPVVLAASAVFGFSRVRDAARAAFRRTPVKALCAAVVAADWAYVVLNGN